jgi:acetylornithine deacetylase/succinyl-diaminopimelate desuccinylase-like protein
MDENQISRVIEEINNNFDSVISETQRFVRQRGISATGEGMEESFEMTKSYLEQFGADGIKEYPSKNYPYLYCKFNSKKQKARTMVAYCSMDMVPVNPKEWVVPPHNAEICDPSVIGLPERLGKIMIGRGTSDKRGEWMSFMSVLRAIRHIIKDIPLNIHFIMDFQEEIGAPDWDTFIPQMRNVVADADFAWMPVFAQDLKGVLEILCGYKGLMMFELSCRGGEWGGNRDARDMWSPHSHLYDSPVKKLLQAVTSLWDKEGEIAIRGVKEAAAIPPEDQKYWAIFRDEFDPETDLKVMNVSRFRDGKDGKKLYTEFLQGPILNLSGIISGQTGERFSSVFPQSGTAKFDLRFGPPMTTSKAEGLIRKHLDDNGFGMVDLKVVGRLEPGKSPTDHPIVKATIKATQAMGVKYRVCPISKAADPLGSFCRPPFNLPEVIGGLGIMGRVHMPNEFTSLNGMKDFMKHTVRVLDEFSKLDEIPKNRMDI